MVEGAGGLATSPTVSVLMPTFDQASLLPRAVESLLAQSFTDWELVIVDDGSPTKDTWEAVQGYVGDRVRFERRDVNGGLGSACNAALERAKADLVAYLPSDDVWFAEHLESLVDCFSDDPDAVLAYSGVRNEYRVPGKGVLQNRTSDGQISGLPLQMVQVAHRRTEDRWIERSELVTDDLERMFWSKLRPRGSFVATGRQSCEWIDHPLQWHKVVQEPLGGINPYRTRYSVAHPLRFETTVGNRIDETATYRRFRERPDTPRAADGLKILLVGELAFNPERVLALEERGHQLFGLWTPAPHWFNAVGPQPFGHVTDLPRDGWRQAVHELEPDVVYGLLNWEAVPFAHEVLSSIDAPMVWHFKESPFDCLANGTWDQLLDLMTLTAAQVYSSAEMRDWFGAVDPRILSNGLPAVLDGDLPKADWFPADRSPLLSATDGQIHTVVPGGPIGITTELITELAAADVHVHFYGDFHRGQWLDWVAACQEAGPRTFHLHPQVNHAEWVRELSQYDAGWLHQLRSSNGGELRRADWGDLNVAARVATYAVSGLPMILPDNSGHTMAMQSLVTSLGVGVLWQEPTDLVAQLKDNVAMTQRRERMWAGRDQFTFDSHVDDLVDLFRQAIAAR